MSVRRGFLHGALLAAGLAMAAQFALAGTVETARLDGATRDYGRTEARYAVPSLELRDRHGARVRLEEVLAAGRPVLLQFIFTSCATICPVMSATFARAQEALRDVHPDTRLVSVSIDPEYDTPERLRAYAARHQAGENWRFLTGRYEDVDTLIRAFDALFEANNKMYHKPYTYLRAPGANTWVRLTGLLSARQLVGEYERLLARADNDVARAPAQ